MKFYFEPVHVEQVVTKEPKRYDVKCERINEQYSHCSNV